MIVSRFRSRSGFGLMLILLVAGALRLFQLGAADVITDEALIAFRSIGYIDFFASPYQTTPYEWFSDVPRWAMLSFHDHPPLVFLLQHWFFMLFGESVLTLRLPFALAGTASVYLLYFVGRKLFNERTGLIAAALLAVSPYHVWISRIGLQESVVIFFSLLTLYFFIKSFDDYRFWYGWGVALGLAFLTKYTAFILLPVFLIYLVWKERHLFKQIHVWLAVALALLVFSPVLVYNASLFSERGHFDLQFSHVFGQQVEAWQSLPGKIQAGGIADRLFDLAPRFYQGLLLPMSLLLISALAYLLMKFFRSARDDQKPLLLLGLLFDFYLLSFLLTGPASRFVVVITPIIALIAGWFIAERSRWLRISLVSGIIIFELFFTVDTLFLVQPVGAEDVTYSRLRRDSAFWGYHQLDQFIEATVSNKRPAVSFSTRYRFLEDIKQQALTRAANNEPAGILFVYDQNMDDLAALWVFHRQLVYRGWPVLTADQFMEQDRGIWAAQGITDIYFVDVINDMVLQRPLDERTTAADLLAEELNDIEPTIIKRPDGRAVFAVYTISF